VIALNYLLDSSLGIKFYLVHVKRTILLFKHGENISANVFFCLSGDSHENAQNESAAGFPSGICS